MITTYLATWFRNVFTKEIKTATPNGASRQYRDVHSIFISIMIASGLKTQSNSERGSTNA